VGEVGGWWGKYRAQDEQLKLEYAVMEEERERLLVMWVGGGG